MLDARCWIKANGEWRIANGEKRKAKGEQHFIR
jgi:hypothetical protein